MSAELPNDVYDKVISGEMSLAELQELQVFADGLETFDIKAAAAGMYVPTGAAAKASKALSNPLAQIAALGVAGATAGVGLDALKTMAGAVAETAKFKTSLRKILNTHPEIRQKFATKTINLAYRSLWTLNPDIAADPLMGGQYLGRILRDVDPLNPRAGMPRVDSTVLQDLTRARVRRDAGSAAMSQAQQGVSQGLKALSTDILGG